MEAMRFQQLNHLNLRLPLQVSPVNHGSSSWRMHPEIEYTVTENICTGGCYFFLAKEPPLGTRLEMQITIPGETYEVPLARIYCRGKVIRVDPNPADRASMETRCGVAATFEHLHDVDIESIPTTAENFAGAAIA